MNFIKIIICTVELGEEAAAWDPPALGKITLPFVKLALPLSITVHHTEMEISPASSQSPCQGEGMCLKKNNNNPQF